MSDTTTCTNCGTEVPAAAAFCTGCGQALAAAAAPPPPAPPAPVDPAPADDATRVETPGLNDATQVTPPPPSEPAPSPYAAPSTPPPPPAPAASAPWGPATSEPPTAAPWTPPTGGEPPVAPAAAPPAGWQQPTPPPGAPAYAPAAAAPAAAGWQSPSAASPPPWGAATEAPPAAKPGGSVLGGLVGLVGSILVLVGVFSGWVKLGNTGTVTAWSLTAGDGLLKSQTPYVIVALAAAAVVISLVLLTGIARPLARIIALLLGIAIIGVTAANWAEIASFVTDNFPSSFEATTAIGFYFTIAGGVLVIIAALIPAKKS